MLGGICVVVKAISMTFFSLGGGPGGGGVGGYCCWKKGRGKGSNIGAAAGILPG